MLNIRIGLSIGAKTPSHVEFPLFWDTFLWPVSIVFYILEACFLKI